MHARTEREKEKYTAISSIIKTGQIICVCKFVEIFFCTATGFGLICFIYVLKRQSKYRDLTQEKKKKNGGEKALYIKKS